MTHEIDYNPLMTSQPNPAQSSALYRVRATLPPEEFRAQLRQTMLDDPSLTLRKVAEALGVTRQRVGLMVGPLGRPTCAYPGPRPSPRRDEALKRLLELELRVQAGESAEQAARDLGISVSAVWHLGFRSRDVRRAHGTMERSREGCNCWRCRRASGVAVPRGKRTAE